MFLKAITSPTLPEEPVLPEETSLLSTAIGTALLLNAALLMIWDIRWGEAATRTVSLAGREKGQIGSVDPGVMRTEELRERLLDIAPNSGLP